MGIATDMKKLGDDIVASHDARINGLATLTRNTANLLDDGETDRLMKFEELLESIQTRQKERENQQKERGNEVSHMLDNFQKERNETAYTLRKMASGLRGALRKGEGERLKNFAKLLQHIQARQREREKRVNLLLKQANNLLNDIKFEHEKMAAFWQQLNAAMLKRRTESRPTKQK